MSSSSARVARSALAAVLAGVLAACAPVAQQPSRVPQMTDSQLREKALESLNQGIDQYNAGKFADAARSFDTALEHGQLTRPEQGRVRKHLAFIHCVSGREAQCRDEFRKALEIDPNFDLSPAEAGHPIWGPVYRDVRAQLTAASAAPATPAVPRSGAEGVLDEGLAKYNAGSFDAAHKLFAAALKQGLAAKTDQILALKNSAFSLCLMGHRIACRNEFAKIFRIDPDFDLAPAEAGHPAWSKTFADAKRRAQKKR
jgi:tetratricopeptide (TPR) repeat protein